jgi:hypothetical protein
VAKPSENNFFATTVLGDTLYFDTREYPNVNIKKESLDIVVDVSALGGVCAQIEDASVCASTCLKFEIKKAMNQREQHRVSDILSLFHKIF